VRYIQENTVTRYPELRGNTFVFSSVKLSATAPERTFRLEVTSHLRTTRLVIEELATAKSPEPPAQTDEERWRRAGLKPNGEPLDVTQLR
jgi:hypothetical protein